MSSIRRSSLISITLGLLTVIGGYLSFAFLEEAAGQFLECQLEPCIRARRYGAGRPVEACPLRQLQNQWGVWGCFRIYRRVAYDASGLGSCDSRHRLLFEWPIIFWTPRDVQSPRPPTNRLSKKSHSLPSSIRRIIQPTPARTQGQVVVRPTQSCEKIDGQSLPVSALIYACVLELIASRMQSVISTRS